MGGRGRRYFVAELKCYWCGSVGGTLQGDWPLAPGTLAFHDMVDDHRPASAQVCVARLRCSRCGGPLFLDDFDMVRMRSDTGI
jgi:hypothetical protein